MKNTYRKLDRQQSIYKVLCKVLWRLRCILLLLEPHVCPDHANAHHRRPNAGAVMGVARQVDVEDFLDPPRALGHHRDPVRQEDRLVQAVVCQPAPGLSVYDGLAAGRSLAELVSCYRGARRQKI